MTHSLDIFFNENLLKECLDKAKNESCPGDPGLYLYNFIYDFSYEEKFESNFIELVYAILWAWNMNSRAAKLEELPKFKKSIIENRKYLDSIKNCQLKDFSAIRDGESLKGIFENWNLCKQKAKLVTYSKTLHFFLPDLFVPIDRTYTIQFFKGNGEVGEIGKQYKMFCDFHTQFANFVNAKNLSGYIDSKLNRSIPKIIDNVIIGYIKMNGK